uniref:Reverse transcriptase domain-containing protein n=1 Tax=Amphimedon queenslandica TaxID=400682 RepID=A0A1X7TSU5_AMPQE
MVRLQFRHFRLLNLTPIVPVLKPDDSVRICGDYKVTVNTVLQADTYPLPRTEDLFSKLTGGTLFSKVDLAHAYQQIALNEEWRKLTSFNTHKVLFQYNRLPFGMTSAYIFQRILETLLANIPQVRVYLNDTLVSGIDEHDHIQTLSQVLSKLDSTGFTVKNAKCQFGLKSISYLVTSLNDSLHPSPDKVKAIQEALECYSRKMPHGHGQKLKGKHIQTLKHSYNHRPLILSVDASPYGLGAVLIHQMIDGCDKLVSFASRSLSQAENYYQIEIEALAIIFGVRKFHQYLHGRHFHNQSDHKPLQYLFHDSKQVPAKASACIQ